MRRRWRFVVVAGAVILAAGAAAVAGVALNVATGSKASWFPTMDSHYLWWLAGSTIAVAICGVLTWWSQRWYERRLVELIPAEQLPESWVVDRPVEINAIVKALRGRRDPTTVGITTAMYGTGGFGKTTAARLVRADRRVLRRYRGRVYWVTLGRDVRRDALTRLVNDLVRQIDPAQAQPFTDVRQAAEHLAAVLAAGPQRLIVLDDVWFDDQLAAFPIAGKCTRLVTTRVKSLVDGANISVQVDQMPLAQARAVLTTGLAPMPPQLVKSLLAETGRWPLLLRLANKYLVAHGPVVV